ncbi:MAG: DUF4198 domain-containing protein [Bacteroidota bacterium]
MKRLFFSLTILVLLSSHDMFLKLDQYFLEPNTDAVIALYNGTFDQSDNVITRDRMIDVSLVGSGKRTTMDTSAWFEKDKTTYLNLTTGSQGTWVAGVSTKPRTFGMSAKSFNDYLKHDGVLDMLTSRETNGTLGDSAIEKYSKHVKIFFQVGDERTNDYQTELGYPIEFIPLKNPYTIHPDDSLPVKLVFNGQPLANQLVYVGNKAASKHTHNGHTHSHDEKTDHKHDELRQFRTDEQGLFNVPISSEGIWYIRTIHLVEVEEEGLTHESNWATITFAVGKEHAHEHDHEEGIPGYVFGLLSVLIVAVLFFWFNRKK